MASTARRSKRVRSRTEQKAADSVTPEPKRTSRRTRSTAPRVCLLNDEDLLKSLRGRSGIYIISPYWHPSRGATALPVFADDNTDDEKDPTVLVKLGVSVARDADDRSFRAPKSRGLEGRVDSYLLCYPLGFTIFGIFSGEAQKARAFEGNFQQYLAGKGRKREDLKHSHAEEWYELKLSEIETLIETIRAGGRKFHRSEFYCGPRGRWFSVTNRQPARTVQRQATPDRRRTDRTIRSRRTPLRTVKKARRSRTKQ